MICLPQLFPYRHLCFVIENAPVAIRLWPLTPVPWAANLITVIVGQDVWIQNYSLHYILWGCVMFFFSPPVKASWKQSKNHL